MYNASAEFQTMALNETRELVIKATLQTTTDTYQLTAEDFEQGKFSVKDSCMSKGFELGTATARSCSLELNNRDGKWDNVTLDGATLTPYCGYILSTGTEFVPMGVFIIDEPGRPYSSLQLKATDRMILLDEPLQDVDIGWPATHRTLISAIAQHCNVPLAGSVLDLLSMEYIIPEPADLDKLTCRDAVGELALMACGFARFSRTGYLEIIQIKKPAHEEAHVMPVGSRKNFKQTSDPISITGMIYENLYWGEKDYPLEIKKLSLIDENNIDEILSNVFVVIDNYTYTAFTADYYGNPAIDSGDTVLHQTKDGKTILSIITKHNYVHGGTCKMVAEGTSSAAVNYKSANERRMTLIASQATEPLQHNLNSYQQSTAILNDLVGRMLGVYRTEETLEDGSVKYWFHDQQSLEESQIIWGFNGVALTYSSDGGNTWSGIDAESDTVIAKVVSALQIRASQLIIDQGSDLANQLDEKANKTVIDELGITITENTTIDGEPLTYHMEQVLDGLASMESQITALEYGGGNMVRNPQLGDGLNPASDWWADGNTYQEVEAKKITWGAVKAANKTWQDAKDGGI